MPSPTIAARSNCARGSPRRIIIWARPCAVWASSTKPCAVREAVKIEPGLVVARANLARIFKASGRLAEAEASLRQALVTIGQHPDLLEELAWTLLAQGRQGEAIQAIAGALAIRETPGARSTFVSCIKELDVASGAEQFRPVLIRALRESWARPESIARISLDIIKQDPDVAESVARAVAAWPHALTETGLYGADGVLAVAENELLLVLLCSTPNADFAFEQFLTLARQILLDSAEAEATPAAAIEFYGALARQCFLNEYVFRLADDERLRVHALRDSLVAVLEAGKSARPDVILALACYQPLSSLPQTERLLDNSWPAAVEAVLGQQVVEVREEVALRADIPRLTSILDGGSLKVQAQYETNPYPRWLDEGASEPPQNLADYLAAVFPLAELQPLSASLEPAILVAGCGTGRNALDTARAFRGSRTLAIDLSVASLAHALRKTREAGISNLSYGQADILEVGSLDRSFDLIEAVGVLHHLSDPLTGWRALLTLLRPGGVMKLGFYSAVARQDLPQMDIGEPTEEAVRAARQSLAARKDAQALQALRAPDFYSISGCRDLLFHILEKRLTLGEIDTFLRAEGLHFLGFILPDAILAAYRRRFPRDPAAIDLGCWEIFEQENPDIFAEMYQFWVQSRR